ncbi:phage tailspike protein [Pectobacterium brasiliense]|uniref:phage tailspike protein n=1 Tax=Pectobacterium brasiliense TaxID=180957 RepID=UPI0001A42740
MADITPNVVVSMPSQLFTLARSFKANANGKIYIGEIDSDPTIPENQIQVYIENEDGSHVPVAQPILINSAGYPVYNGQIAKFVTAQGHSMAIYDAYNVQQFYFPNVLKYDPDQLRADLSVNTGASLIKTSSGNTVQQEIDGIKKDISVITNTSFNSIDDVFLASIDSNDITIKYKYGVINYKSTGVVTQSSSASGDGYLIYDSNGKEFKINEPKRTYLNNGRFSFTELWYAEKLDPSFFIKLSSIGVSNIVLYSWSPYGLKAFENFLNLCEIYGFGVVFQPVSNGEYSNNIPSDFGFFSSLLDHNAVIGLYLLDEPTLDNYPISRQSTIISVAKGLSDKPLYVSTNSEANFNVIPVHKDFDFVFTSNYSHYVDVDGLTVYAATTWALAEENGFRRGRVIPLLTAYYYPEEVPVFNRTQMVDVNNYISERFDKFGVFMFYGGRDAASHRYIENDDEIYSLLMNSLSRSNNSRTMGMFRELMTGGVADSSIFMDYKIPSNPESVVWLDGSTSGNWSVNNKCPRLKTGMMVPVEFGRYVVIEKIIASFVDENGPSNTSVISLYINPQINSGVKIPQTSTITGGGMQYSHSTNNIEFAPSVLLLIRWRHPLSI